MRQLTRPVMRKMPYYLLGSFVYVQLWFLGSSGQDARLLPQTWLITSRGIMVLLFLLFTGMFLVHDRRFKAAAFSVSMLLSVILLIPGRENLFFYSPIIDLMIVESFLYFSVLIGWVVCLIYCGYLFYVAGMSLTLWSVPVPPMDMRTLCIVVCSGIVCAIFSTFFIYQKSYCQGLIAEIEGLRESNELLASTNINLQDLIVQERNVALLRERNRIARELHDTIACTLINSLSLLDAYRLWLQSQSIDSIEPLTEGCKLIRQGFADMRRTVSGLRREDQVSSLGLRSIKTLVELFHRAACVNITLNFGDVPSVLDHSTEELLYRAVQEGLTNAVRHGRASEIHINFRRYQGGIELRIRDNGVGVSEIKSGYGLLGMEERVREKNGNVHISSEPGEGFYLTIWVPIDR